ncbi:FixH family protein [Mameliella sediminis]|uniref:FixH family protein n=1 Tax=Mameliella sediminis TaxID=2836866 RepID=UPI001C43F10A|nr:FixH family protein [Mameliella sediminis]MBY6117079.1 FixH family protein [Antarctobacter heliothermus]MBY6146831.1 FixH family protein [Mameliella alba]MBV7396287.1 FixH family protein [Mameliella sediminis]MBY6160697.1 FixH family protein [Mameliella alba]MBY6169167.1 FixH family protein [Mameliella alba]
MTKKEFKLTGWHVLGIFGGAFSVIIGVNVALAVNAVSTFPGLEVANSYVASQTFDKRRAAQEALGWNVEARIEQDMLVLSITDDEGRPIHTRDLTATVGRPTNVSEDRTPEFAFNGRAYVAHETLRPGNWDVWLKATALDGTLFEQRLQMTVAN